MTSGMVVRELRSAEEARRRAVDRYRVAASDAGPVLHCDETPGIAVHIDARFAFSEADARRLGPRVILLDGAGQFAPLIDGDAKLYNLDHHQGCVRAFTLATCEQALVLVSRGLELDRGSWTVYANEPDLDAVVAIWVLLNHRRVGQLSAAARQILLPLVRLEGAIDANGTETADFCGVTEPALAESRRRLDHLYRREQVLRGLADLEAPARTAALLREIDTLVFEEGEFATWRPVEKLYGNVELDEELVAVACRDSAGIYDVEKRLRERWGARLGLIVLESQPGRYTLRASAALDGVSLGPLFGLLNAVDPAVDGRPESQRWGGSDEIGGSPRDRLSRLTPERVLRAAHWVHGRPLRLVRATLRALWMSAAVAALSAGLGLLLWAIPAFRPPPAIGEAVRLALVGACALAAGAWLARRETRAALWIPGWRAPAGRSWLALVAVAVLCGALGGAWIPGRVDASAAALAAAAAASLLAGLGVEVWFRGWVHGLLSLASPPRAWERRPLLSPASLVSGGLYALATLIGVEPAARLPIALPIDRLAIDGLALTALLAALAGVVLGIARERSRSLWPGIAAQLAASALALLTLA